MSKAKWSSNRYVSEADKKAKKETRILLSNVALIIAWSVIMFCIGFDIGFNANSYQKEPKHDFFIYQKIR